MYILVNMTCDKCNCESVYVLESKDDIVKDRNLYILYCPVCDDIILFNIDLRAYILPTIGEIAKLKAANADTISKVRGRNEVYRILGEKRDKKQEGKKNDGL